MITGRRGIWRAHTKNVHCAVLTVGGWFDAEDLQGPFTLFHAIERDDPGIFNALVVGAVGARRVGIGTTEITWGA